MFSVIYYPLFRTRLFRIPRYFELIVLSLHLKSTPLFRTCQKQSTYIRAQLETYCILFELVMFDSRAVSFTIDKSIRKNQKQRNIQRVFNATASVNLSDYNYFTYFYLIGVFLHTVLYFIKKWFIVTNFTLPRLFRNPAISNSSFFPYTLNQPRYIELVKNRVRT